MNTEQKHTLLPCPFCGGKAKEYERFNSNTVTCLVCGVKVRQSEMGQGDASERWNRRAALQSRDREDAERYRWIRSKENECNVEIPTKDAVGYLLPGYGEELDAAIDHARRVEGEEK